MIVSKASEPTYTVADYVASMEACGAHFTWSPEGVWQNIRAIDLEAFQTCQARALDAGITTMDVWQYLKNSQISPAKKTANVAVFKETCTAEAVAFSCGNSINLYI